MSSPAKTVRPLDFKYCNQERAGMGPPTLQISDKSVKSVAAALIVQKWSILTEVTGYGHSTLTRCSCHTEQRQELPTVALMEAGLRWVLEW